MQPRWLDQWCSGNGVGGYRQLNSCMVICSNPRIGLETVLTLFITTAQFGVPSALISTSSGLIFCMRTLGAAVCFPMCNAIFNSQITKHFPAEVAGAISPLGFPPKDLPAFITALRAGNITAVMEIHGVTTEIINAGQHEQQSAYVGSFCRMWIFPLTLSAVAFIAAFFLIKPKDEFTMHVDAPIEESSKDYRMVSNTCAPEKANTAGY